MRTTGLGSAHHLLNGRTYGMELVVPGNLLNQRPIIFKQHKEAQVIEQDCRRQQTPNQRFQLIELTQGVEVYPVNRAPLHKALGIGRQ